MPLYYPGTSYPVSHSFGNHATFNAEFDDSLLDQASWKNSRYEGARLVAKEINKFSDGDTSYQNLPVITNRTTALYIALLLEVLRMINLLLLKVILMLV